MSEMISILIVEDLPTDAELCEREIKKVLGLCEFRRVETCEEYLAALKEFRPGLIISDYKLPHFDGLTALKLALEHAPDVPFIILTGSMNEDTAVECMKTGAWDYVIKEHIKRLGQAVISALEDKRLRQERKRADEALKDSEERYRTLVENALVGVYKTNLKGEILYVNEALSKIFEFESSEEMMLSGVLPRYKNLKDREVLIENLKKKGKVDNFEVEIFTKTEKNKSILMNATLDGDVISGMVLDITERKRAEMALQESERKYRQLVETLQEGIWVIDKDSYVTFVNLPMAQMLGYTVDEMLGKHLFSFMDERGVEICKDYLERRKQGIKEQHDFEFIRKDGIRIIATLETGPIIDDNGNYAGAIAGAIDITERKRAEEYQKLLTQVLELLNQTAKKSDMDIIRDIILLIKELTGFEAVGVRLKEGVDFPYYYTSGFPSDFVKAERYLCARDHAGELIRDSKGNPYLECMCGNVICRRINPSLPFFTKGGSFWTNSTTELLASTTEEDRQARTRNRCNGEGYESVALIPLLSDSEIIGLLQLNDSRKGMFTLEMVSFFEKIGDSIGIALERKRAEELLKESENKYRTLVENLPQKIFLKDRNLVYISCNESYAKDLKIRPDEITGKTDYDFYPKDLAEKYRADDKKIMELGNTEDMDEEYIPNGAAIWIHTVKTPVKDEKSNVIGILGIFWDITEKRQMEENIKKRVKDLEEFYQMAIGRELRMIELKEEIESLKEELEKYKKPR